MDTVCRILNKKDISVMLVVPVFKIVSFNQKNPQSYQQQLEVLSVHLLWLSYFISTNIAVLNGSLLLQQDNDLSLSSTDALTPITYRNMMSLRICCAVSNLVEIGQQIQRLQG